jgi:hypothetical protein
MESRGEWLKPLVVRLRALIAVVMLDYTNLEANNELQEKSLREKPLFHTV